MSRSIEKMIEWASELVAANEWLIEWVTLATDLRLSRSWLWCYCDVVIWYLVTFRPQLLSQSSGYVEERAHFLSTFPPCPSVLSNNTTSKAHKFVDHKYRVIRNDCRSFNNLPYTSFSRCNPMWFLSMGLCQGSGLCSSSSRKYPGTQNRHWNHHRWHATNGLERTRLSCWCL